jgi:glycosyltransferase involved in cell wall biosynthesis
MTALDVDVIHEYGADRHFLALEHSVKHRGGRVHHAVLNPGKAVKDALRQRSPRPLWRYAGGWLRLLALISGRRRTVVIGIAPYSAWVWLLWWLRWRHAVVYFSSWPDWQEGGAAPHHPRSSTLRAWWRRALDGLSAVGVSREATRQLRAFGAHAMAIPHAVDVDAFEPGRRRSVGAPPTVLFVGRLVEEKGLRDLVAAARIVSASRPDVRWAFAGRGPLEGFLEEQKALGLRLVLLGHLRAEDLTAAYESADLLVLPSYRTVEGWQELFGIVLVEAFAAGLPVVATDCVGPKEVVADGLTGRLVPQRDVAALASALLELLADPEQRLSMATRARSEATERYAIDVVGGAWDAHLREAHRSMG